MTRLVALSLAGAAALSARTIVVITADASDWVLSAGGTIASMVDRGDRAILIRVTNDEKDSWKLGIEETAARVKNECEAAARALGVSQVISLGYRAGELGGVSHTELRDRIMFYIRLHKPDVLFIPNPYAEYVEVLDRHYTGLAAEEARRVAALRNHQPPFADAGLTVHITPELYYYAQPFDPRRREPESSATFVPQPKVLDIAPAFARKLRAAQALKTINNSTAMRIKERLDTSARRLPLLDAVNEASVEKLVAINVAKLAEIGARGSAFRQAEEFLYAGPELGVPEVLRKRP